MLFRSQDFIRERDTSGAIQNLLDQARARARARVCARWCVCVCVCVCVRVRGRERARARLRVCSFGTDPSAVVRHQSVSLRVAQWFIRRAESPVVPGSRLARVCSNLGRVCDTPGAPLSSTLRSRPPSLTSVTSHPYQSLPAPTNLTQRAPPARQCCRWPSNTPPLKRATSIFPPLPLPSGGRGVHPEGSDQGLVYPMYRDPASHPY